MTWLLDLLFRAVEIDWRRCKASLPDAGAKCSGPGGQVARGRNDRRGKCLQVCRRNMEAWETRFFEAKQLQQEEAVTKTLRLENDDLASELRDLYEKLAEAQGLFEALQHRLFLELFSYIAHVFNLKHLNWSWPWFIVTAPRSKTASSSPWRCLGTSWGLELVLQALHVAHHTPPLCERKEASWWRKLENYYFVNCIVESNQIKELFSIDSVGSWIIFVVSWHCFIRSLEADALGRASDLKGEVRFFPLKTKWVWLWVVQKAFWVFQDSDLADKLAQTQEQLKKSRLDSAEKAAKIQELEEHVGMAKF